MPRTERTLRRRRRRRTRTRDRETRGKTGKKKKERKKEKNAKKKKIKAIPRGNKRRRARISSLLPQRRPPQRQRATPPPYRLRRAVALLTFGTDSLRAAPLQLCDTTVPHYQHAGQCAVFALALQRTRRLGDDVLSCGWPPALYDDGDLCPPGAWRGVGGRTNSPKYSLRTIIIGNFHFFNFFFSFTNAVCRNNNIIR